MNFKLIVLVLSISFSNSLYSLAQQHAIDTAKYASTPSPKESLKTKQDSLRFIYEKLPKRSTLRSAIVPGLGQITNKRWWKVPLIYGGFIIFILAYQDNQESYLSFLKEAQYRTLNPGPGQFENPNYQAYNINQIKDAKDGFRRNRDLCVLGLVGVYIANVVDAYVDAKFFRFDISDKLSLRVTPSVQVQPQMDSYSYATIQPAIKIKLTL